MDVGAGSSVRALLTLSFGAACISFAAVFVKMLGGGLVGPTAIGFWRTFLGAAILFSWSALRRNRLTMPWPIMGWSLLAGFIFFLDLFFWHRSIVYVGAGMATILANMQVFTTGLLSFLVFRERVTSRFFLAAVGAVMGIALFIGWGSAIQVGAQYAIGVFFGLLTSVLYASYIVTMKVAGHKENRPDSRTLMAWTSLFTATFLAVASMFEEAAFVPPDLYSVLVLFSLALVVQALGWWAITNSLPKLDVSRAGLLLLLQPMLATVWGVIFFGEHFTAVQVLGAVIALAAIYGGSLRHMIRA